MSSVNSLDVLANEILLECLKYLTALNIFDAFGHLNTRFSSLIQSIPLHLNFVIKKNRFITKPVPR